MHDAPDILARASHRAPVSRRRIPDAAPLPIPADPLGVTRAHVKALGVAVRALERTVEREGFARTRWARETLTLCADALGRLERRAAR